MLHGHDECDIQHIQLGDKSGQTVIVLCMLDDHDECDIEHIQ